MAQTRIAYMPLVAAQERLPEDAILASTSLVAALKCDLHVTTYAVKIPDVSSALGGYLVDIGELVRDAEAKSWVECRRLQEFVRKATSSLRRVEYSEEQVTLLAAPDAAAEEARYFDLAVLPWSNEPLAVQEMAQTIVFGSGRPVVMVPSTAKFKSIDHIAIAWDGSRVASRALWDALAFLPEKDGRVTVLTARGEKTLLSEDRAEFLVSLLEKRGVRARHADIPLVERTISAALQDAAIEAGAQILAMGEFGHSRVRDFVLGGATKGILTQLRMATLLSH